MKPSRHFLVRTADWDTDRDALRAVRECVFIVEQSVPAELEWDDADRSCIHVLAISDDVPIGAGRLLQDGRIGRMAVLKGWRRQGVGSSLLETLLEIARSRSIRRVLLNAQVGALPFYRGHGFIEEGDEFMDAGIPHRRMRRDI